MADVIEIDARAKTLRVSEIIVPCRIGRDGYIAGELGREGDAKTPLGSYVLRFGLYRADRLPAPRSRLTFWSISEDDGWCDAPEDAAYNRLVRLPYPASHEALWREDGAYDLVIVMSHNDSPPVAGLGSAVFIHVAQADDRATLGCVAITPEGWSQVLPRLFCGQRVQIVGEENQKTNALI